MSSTDSDGAFHREYNETQLRHLQTMLQLLRVMQSLTASEGTIVLPMTVPLRRLPTCAVCSVSHMAQHHVHVHIATSMIE